MDSYSEFVSGFELFKFNHKMGLTETISQTSTSDFITGIQDSLNECHIFHIKEDVKKMLMLTTPPNLNANVNLPFPSIFVDCQFTREELNEQGFKIKEDLLVGVIITKGALIDPISKIEAGTGLRMTTCAINRNDESVYFHTFNGAIDLKDEYKDFEVKILPMDKHIKKFIHQFSINFINLVNDPEIILVESKVSRERNIKRLKRGKPPLKDSTFIRLDEKRKIYLNKVLSGEHRIKSGYAWWVRGHWRTLHDRRYKENQGKRVWIMPFIKNKKGILLKKEYEVD